MSEHIVHTAILLDTQRLVIALQGEQGLFARVMAGHGRFAWLGCTTVAGDSFSFKLLDQLRQDNAPEDPVWQAKLAFVLGWISHRACDRTMKPIWQEAPFKGRGTDVDPKISPFEASIYHEAEAYRRMFEDKPDYRLAVFPQLMADAEKSLGFRQGWADELIKGAYAMALMDIQTIPPQLDDQPRFEEMCMRVQKFYVDLARYRRAIEAPDQGHMAAFVTDINWYDLAEPAIQAAEALRAGQAIGDDLLQAATHREASCYYGQGLQLSLSYVMSALAYLDKPEHDMAWLRDKLDIGRLSPEGLAV